MSYANAREILERSCSILAPPEHTTISDIDYAEKYPRIKTEDTPPLIIPFRMNPIQCVYRSLKAAVPVPKATGKRILTLKARRMGITTYEQITSYATVRTKRGSELLTIAQSKPEAEKIFRMVHLMHDTDPNYMRLDLDRNDALAYKALRTCFTITSCGAVAVSRGSTLVKVHGTEVAHWDLNYDDTNNLVIALGTAARRGELIMETTAKGLDNWFAETWKEAERGKNIWTPIFLGWYLDPRNSIQTTYDDRVLIKETLDEEEAYLVERFNCNINQLAWRREVSKGGAKYKKLFKQEYPATADEAFQATGSSFFNSDTLSTLSLRCKEPIRETEGLTIWKNPEPGHKYIIAADTSEGMSDSDPTPIGVLDWATGEQVLRNDCCLRPVSLGHKCVEYAKLYNGGLITIENNNTGHSAINTVMNQCMYGNIYYHENELRDDAKEDVTPGWRTTPLTKPMMLGELDEALEKEYMIVNDKRFLDQCRSFRETASGSAGVARSKVHHGDIVIMWAIAWQARKSRWMSEAKPIL